ncbi:Rpn family recombination-promoting nuclease/putative transposase [Spirochaeta dissipatitropha]
MSTKDRPLNPMADIFVRYLLGSEENKDILIDFINAVFVQKGHEIVVELEIRNPFNLAVVRGDKESILDVKAKDTTGRWINVEVQVDDNGSFANRSLYYWAKNYADQLKSGNFYRELAPTICINLLNFEIFPQLPGYHSCFHITEQDAPEFVLTEHLQIHFIEVPKNHREHASDVKDKLDGWIFYFENEGNIEEDQMTVLLKDNPAIGKAHRVYKDFTANDELMDMAEAREKWRRDVDSRLHNAKLEGIQQARIEDARKMRDRGFSIEDIADITGLSEEEIRDL